MGTQAAAIFFLGSHWCPAAAWSRDVTEQAPSEPGRQGGLLPDLLKTPTDQLCRTHSKFLFSPAVLPATLEASIAAHGFPLLTLPSVEVRSRHTVREPVLGLTLFSPQL